MARDHHPAIYKLSRRESGVIRQFDDTFTDKAALPTDVHSADPFVLLLDSHMNDAGTAHLETLLADELSSWLNEPLAQ